MAPANWDTREQIDNHKLASSIINGHGDEQNEVLDNGELDLLQRFITDTSSRQAIMNETGWTDELSAKKAGSLAGYLVARHGTEDPALDDRDIEMLKEWFEKDMPAGQSVAR